jgi:transglutaminase-like putative cysteine protease
MGYENRARLAFAGLLVATLLTFSRLFDSGPYLGPALLGAVLATVVTGVARRLGMSSLASLALAAGGLVWYLAVVFQMRRLFYGLPTARALAGVAADLGQALTASGIDFAPVPPRPGYVIALAAGAWAAAALGEVAVFRWHQPLTASLLPIMLFAFVLVVGTGQGASFFVVLFVAALFAFWATESSLRLRLWGRWVSAFTEDDAVAGSPTASVARRMGASCLTVALLAPLVLPGVDEGIVAWRTGIGAQGPGTGIGTARTVDLLVSLAPTLREQTGQELFEVTADAPSYWRLTSLANFDGRDWTPARADSITLSDLRAPSASELGSVQRFQYAPSAPPSRLTRNRQRYELIGLGGNVLPAASHAADIRLDPASERDNDDLEVDAGTGAITLDGGLVQGVRYETTSLVPEATFTDLRRADVADPGPAYTTLPASLSPDVADLTRRWVVGETTPFEQLVTIQDRLRTFRYSLDVEPEDSADYLTTFLTETKRGYCQQFATAFAVMARILGYPSRVSVGFLTGTPTNEVPGQYLVTGSEAHAWPEVYFEDFGWVAFEPTPRTIASEPSYTSPALGSIAGSDNALPAGSDSENPGRSTRLREREGAAAERLPGGAIPGFDGAVLDPEWIAAFNRLVGGLALLVALFLIAVPVAKELRTMLAYRRAASPVGAALAAFAHFQAEGADLATPRRTSESPLAYAARLARQRRASNADALALARICEAAAYSARGVTDAQAGDARALARRLRRSLWRSASWAQRCERLFSPAGLVAGRSGGGREQVRSSS